MGNFFLPKSLVLSFFLSFFCWLGCFTRLSSLSSQCNFLIKNFITCGNLLLVHCSYKTPLAFMLKTLYHVQLVFGWMHIRKG